MGRTKIHVTPNSSDPDKDWKVKKEGTSKASGLFEDKEDAIEFGKKLAKNSGLGQIFIHGKDGKIQTEHTYGQDPEKYKG